MRQYRRVTHTAPLGGFAVNISKEMGRCDIKVNSLFYLFLIGDYHLTKESDSSSSIMPLLEFLFSVPTET